MESYKTLECVIEYIEKCINSNDVINYEAISIIAGCPASLFQRIFIFVTGMNIAEYYRRRRLTLAGSDIRKTDLKIIDIAFRYGYNSHSAFTRAFKEFHNISPTEARKTSARLMEFPPLSFTNQRIVGGKPIMAKLNKIEYEQIGERKVIGREKRTDFTKAGQECWDAAFQEGVFDKLQEVEAYVCNNLDDYVGLGHMSQFDQNDSFRYIIGKIVDLDAPIADGLSSELISAGTVAKIWIEGSSLNEIISSAYLICTEAITTTGYKLDNDNFYWCDVYTYERFCNPISKRERIILDYLLPVMKA